MHAQPIRCASQPAVYFISILSPSDCGDFFANYSYGMYRYSKVDPAGLVADLDLSQAKVEDWVAVNRAHIQQKVEEADILPDGAVRSTPWPGAPDGQAETWTNLIDAFGEEVCDVDGAFKQFDNLDQLFTALGSNPVSVFGTAPPYHAKSDDRDMAVFGNGQNCVVYMRFSCSAGVRAENMQKAQAMLVSLIEGSSYANLTLHTRQCVDKRHPMPCTISGCPSRETLIPHSICRPVMPHLLQESLELDNVDLTDLWKLADPTWQPGKALPLYQGSFGSKCAMSTDPDPREPFFMQDRDPQDRDANPPRSSFDIGYTQYRPGIGAVGVDMNEFHMSCPAICDKYKSFNNMVGNIINGELCVNGTNYNVEVIHAFGENGVCTDLPQAHQPSDYLGTLRLTRKLKDCAPGATNIPTLIKVYSPLVHALKLCRFPKVPGSSDMSGTEAMRIFAKALSHVSDLLRFIDGHPDFHHKIGGLRFEVTMENCHDARTARKYALCVISQLCAFTDPTADPPQPTGSILKARWMSFSDWLDLIFKGFLSICTDFPLFSHHRLQSQTQDIRDHVVLQYCRVGWAYPKVSSITRGLIQDLALHEAQNLGLAPAANNTCN